MEALFFGYNIVLHLPITIVNMVIINKEVFMEVFQMSSKNHGHNGDLALGFMDFLNFWGEMLGWLNPMNWLKFIKKEFYTKLYKKYVMSS